MSDKLTVREIINELVERSNSNIRRLRMLEQKTDMLAGRVENLEKAVLDLKREIKSNTAEFKALIEKEGAKLAKLEAALKDIVKELKRKASLSKVKELEGLLEVFNPLKSEFVTREEVARMIKELKS